MLLRVCFVASFLQKYGCIRLDSLSYKTQYVSLVLVSTEKSSLIPQEKPGGVQFRICGSGSMVSLMPRPLFFPAPPSTACWCCLVTLQHSCYSPGIILTQKQTGKTLSGVPQHHFSYVPRPDLGQWPPRHRGS